MIICSLYLFVSNKPPPQYYTNTVSIDIFYIAIIFSINIPFKKNTMDHNTLVSYTHIDIVIAATGKIDQYKICVAIGRDFHPLSDIHRIRLAICDLQIYQV